MTTTATQRRHEKRAEAQRKRDENIRLFEMFIYPNATALPESVDEAVAGWRALAMDVRIYTHGKDYRLVTPDQDIILTADNLLYGAKQWILAQRPVPAPSAPGDPCPVCHKPITDYQAEVGAWRTHIADCELLAEGWLDRDPDEPLEAFKGYFNQNLHLQRREPTDQEYLDAFGMAPTPEQRRRLRRGRQ
jgi:hypothetical protein